MIATQELFIHVCMYVCMYVCIYVYIHTHIHTFYEQTHAQNIRIRTSRHPQPASAASQARRFSASVCDASQQAYRQDQLEHASDAHQ